MNEFERWEGRFAAPHYIFGEAPNYFLVSCQELLPKTGRALAVADGEGRNGVWLAGQGLDVVSLDFSPMAQKKAAELAARTAVEMEIIQGDVHEWDYPSDTFDVVVEILTQFSSPEQRLLKWAGMKRALKPGGVLVIQGYSPKQLEFGTGGPKKLENLYTQALLEENFSDLDDLNIYEEERVIEEGTSHSGMSAVINLTARG